MLTWFRDFRAWWHACVHAFCPVCGQEVSLVRGWLAHKETHGLAAWKQALREELRS